MLRRFRSVLSAGIALMFAAEAAVQPAFAESRQPIGIVEFANVSTALTVGEVPDYTAYLLGDALMHAGIINEGWGCVSDMRIHTSKNENNPVPDAPVGEPYCYLIALRADEGCYFAEGFDLCYDGEPIDSARYTADIQDDGETLILYCDFIPQVVPLAPDAQALSEVYILDAALDFSAGEAPRFTAHPADPSLVSVCYERWVDVLDDTRFITNNAEVNQVLGLTDANRLTAFAANGQYHYDICVKANYGYVFADDVKLFVNGVPCAVSGHSPDTIAVNEVHVLHVGESKTETTAVTSVTAGTTSAAKPATTVTTVTSAKPVTTVTTVTSAKPVTTVTAVTSAKPVTTTAKPVTTEMTVPTAVFNPELLYGDLNQDGRCSAADLVLLLRYLAEEGNLNLSAKGVSAADLNLDGLIDMQDARKLMKLVLQAQGTQEPVPPKSADFGADSELTLPDTGEIAWIFKPEGDSAAYTDEPITGLTVSVPENALEYDGQLRFSELADDEAEKFDQACAEAGGLLLDAWHVDAGLEPDAHLPGCYACSYDLSQTELPAEMYGDLHLLRIADDGTAEEYPIEIEGKTLKWMSDQNSITLLSLCIDTAIIVVALGAIVSGSEYSKWIESQNGCAGCYETGRFKIYYHDNEPENTKAARKKRLNEIECDATQKAREFAEAKVGDAWGGIAGLFMNYAREVNRIAAQKKNEILSADAEYQELRALENGHPSDVVLLARQCEIALDYLYLHERCPKLKKPDIIFSETLDNLGEAATNYILRNYMLVRRTPQKDNTHIPKDTAYSELYDSAVPAAIADQLLTTLTHEMFHLIQATKLAGKYEANVKFFEMSAIAVECHSAQYYKDCGYIANHVLDTGDSYETFGYPVDEVSAMLTEANHSLQTQSGYALARFLMYIESIHKKEYKGWDMICAYKKYGTISAMLSHICGFAEFQTESGKPDDVLNVYWEHFQKQRATEAIALGCAADNYNLTKDTNNRFPSLMKKHKMQAENPTVQSAVPVKNMACTLVGIEGAGDRAWSVLLVPAPDFGEQQPEHKFLIPAANAKQKGQDTKNGTAVTAAGPMMYYRELQGSGAVGASAYTICYIPAPDTPEVELDREKETLTVKLQTAPSNASQTGKTDRFLIICSIDGTDEYTVPVAFDKWDKEIVIPFSLLPLHLDTKNKLRLTVCEMIDKGGEFAECRLAQSNPYEAELGEAELERTMHCGGKFGNVSVSSQATFKMQMNGSFQFTFEPYFHETKPEEPDTDYQPPSGDGGNPFDGGEVDIRHTIGYGKSEYSGFTVTGRIKDEDDPHNWTAEITSCSPDSFRAYYKSVIEQLDVDTEMEWKGSGMQSGTVQLSTDEKGEMKIMVSIVTAEGNISLSGSFK